MDLFTVKHAEIFYVCCQELGVGDENPNEKIRDKIRNKLSNMSSDQREELSNSIRSGNFPRNFLSTPTPYI